jgi:alpha-1,2-mannosyltransferase
VPHSISLDRRRWAVGSLWFAAAAVAIAQSMAALRRPADDRLADLHVYRESVRLLVNGGSLYDFAAPGTGAPFTYPPFAGLVFSPLSLVPEAPLRIAWTIGTLAVVVLVAALVGRRGDVTAPWGALAAPLVALVLFLSAAVSSNLRFGQVSVVLVALVLVDALRVVPHRYAGIATGVAAAVKLTPLIFIPYWWIAGRRRTAVTAAATFAGCTALAWAVLPGESTRFWLTAIWHLNRVGHITTGGNQSLNGALLRWELPEAARAALVGSIGLAVVALAMWRAVRAHRNDRPLAAVVIVGAAGLVVSPVSWTHHQVWLVLAALLAVSPRRWLSLLWAGTVAVVMIAPVTSVAAGVPIIEDARLLLAIAVACAVPFVAVRRRPQPGAAGAVVETAAVEPAAAGPAGVPAGGN